MLKGPTSTSDPWWRRLAAECLVSAVLVFGPGGRCRAAAPPYVAITSPPGGTLLMEGDTIQLLATAAPTALKVEFYTNGVFLGEVSPPPFAMYWSNVALGTHALTAVAVDDTLARGTSAVMNVLVVTPNPQELTWAPPVMPSGEWNRTAINWRSRGGRPTVFHDGDSVTMFAVDGVVFIGSAGVSMAVSPAATTLEGRSVIHGGDILTGSLTVRSSANVTFSNCTGSLSFPGGTLMQPTTSASLTYDVSEAPNGAAVHFGTGPISLAGSFGFQTGSNRLATLENDFAVNEAGATLQLNPRRRANALTRFTGSLALGGPLAVIMDYASGGSYLDPTPHEWAGPVVLNQSGVRNLSLVLQYGYTGKGLLISGGISDGPGTGTNGLRLGSYIAPSIRLTGTNTYAHGTVVENAYYGSVEVGPHSSLGTGDLRVESSGQVRLMGNGNLAPTASVTLGGRLIVDRGVKVRISLLTLGSTTFTNGLFTGTNGLGFMVSNGTIRLPAVNLPPTVTLTNPADGAAFAAGDTIALQAAVTDVDSYIARVEFRVNGALFGVRTNAPFQLSLRNAPAGRYPVQAVVYDDDGGMNASPVVMITVAPRIDRIERLDPTDIFIEFNSPMNQGCVLEATSTLPPGLWINIGSFPPEPMPRLWRVTNSVTEDLPNRFYRLLVP